MRTRICPNSTPMLKDSSDVREVGAGELERLLECEREAEPMDQPEPEGDHPAALDLGSDDVLECHVHDRHRNQHLDQRWKPQRVRREVKGTTRSALSSVRR